MEQNGSTAEIEQKKLAIERWKARGSIFQAVATLCVSIVGGYYTCTVDTRQANDSRARTIVEIIGQRERAETDFRKNAFENMIDKFYDKKIPVFERLSRLKVFQQNFHDLFNGREIFDVLMKDAEEELKEWPERKEEFYSSIKSMAQDVTSMQEQLIGYDNLIPVHLKIHETKTELLPFREDDKKVDPHYVTIHLESLSDSLVNEPTIHILMEHPSLSRSFHVSYFDVPFTDNILLPDGHRFSVILDSFSVSDSTAQFTLMHFPAHYITAGYRPSITLVEKMISHDHSQDSHDKQSE